jgi:hypothetical protein
MIYLTYGRNLQNELIHISEAARGAQAGLHCPFCGSPLVAKKGPVVIWHFAHAAGESCRQSGATDLIPSYEGYFVYGLTPAQRLTLASVFEAQRTERSTFFDASEFHPATRAALAEKGFLRLIYTPSGLGPYGRRPIARLTTKAQAFAAQLTLAQFADFMAAEYRQACTRLAAPADADEAMAAQLLAVEIERVRATSLYFLRIEAEGENARFVFYKIGITARPLAERVAEITAWLAAHFDKLAVEPLYYLPGLPFVEGYFKAKYATVGLPIGPATEYFEWDDIGPILAEFEVLAARQVDLEPEGRPAGNMPTRLRFRAYFEGIDRIPNDFTGRLEPWALLVDVINLDAGGARFADWLHLAYGKQFEALGHLRPDDIIEFNAAIAGSTLKQPTKFEVKKDD